MPCSPDILRRAFDHILDAALITGRTGTVEFANRQLSALMGSGPSLAARRKDGAELPVTISLGGLESPEGTFVIVTMTLLLKQPPGSGARGHPASAVAAIRPPRPRVLVVLHDRSVREAAGGLLRLHGYPVLVASNLAEAQDIAHGNQDISFLLTEQFLGDTQTGSQLIASLRSTLRADLKVVLLSDDPVASQMTRSDPNVVVCAARMPVQAEELLRMLEDLGAPATQRIG